MVSFGCFSFNKPSFVCEICVKPRNVKKSFNINGCSHSYCKYCIVKYIHSKLQNNITTISCPVPDCEGGGKLEINYCRKILGKKLFDRWGIALCENAISGAEKLYCPYQDCSALLINDCSEVISESECPNCRRLLCAQCKVSWHAGMNCVQFQKWQRENGDDALMNLANRMKWRKCPDCGHYVERKSGCNAMRCRCGAGFCYRHGTRLSFSEKHGHHHCTKCHKYYVLH